MIKAADLPAVRARIEAAGQADNEAGQLSTAPSPGSVPGYPSKKMVLENGRYVVAETTK